MTLRSVVEKSAHCNAERLDCGTQWELYAEPSGRGAQSAEPRRPSGLSSTANYIGYSGYSKGRPQNLLPAEKVITLLCTKTTLMSVVCTCIYCVCVCNVHYAVCIHKERNAFDICVLVCVWVGACARVCACVCVCVFNAYLKRETQTVIRM